MQPALYDAHNHAQDDRLKPAGDSLWRDIRSVNIRRMVVNGSSEADWPSVLALARAHPEVLPSFGYHPWFIRQRTPGWKGTLVKFLDEMPSAVGEIGLDRWIKDHDLMDQEQVFVEQLRLAAERNLPVTIHCLKTWGRLHEILSAGPCPACGFVLHSFGGPPGMIHSLASLGAYFSLPGYYAHERKKRQRDTFLQVPLERLLIETDAPDQPIPPERVRFPLPDEEGRPVNHPANLPAVYDFAAELLDKPLLDLAATIEHNFNRLFGALIRAGAKAGHELEKNTNSTLATGLTSGIHSA